MHAVAEALAAGEELRLIRIAANRTKDAALRALLAKAKEKNVPVRFERRDFFDRIPFKAHQGVVATAPPFPYVALSDLLGRRRGPADEHECRRRVHEGLRLN